MCRSEHLRVSEDTETDEGELDTVELGKSKSTLEEQETIHKITKLVHTY